LILAIDQGTTGTTCLVFDGDGRIRGRAYSEFEQHFPQPGWVEHDAAEIWAVTRRVAAEAIAAAGIDGAQLDGIGIANQRETVVAWDRDSGEPLHNAIVWQDRRTADRCAELKDEGREQLVREQTGLVLDPEGGLLKQLLPPFKLGVGGPIAGGREIWGFPKKLAKPPSSVMNTRFPECVQ